MMIYIISRFSVISTIQLNSTFILMSPISATYVYVLQYALIESKKSYVRYISHELRTPLNSAFLGNVIVTLGLI